MACAHSEGDTARVRTLALSLAVLVPSFALADEIDLSRGGVREDSRAPRVVVRLEGGNDFAPFGRVGGSVSFLLDAQNELEIGAGGGFPGLQLGFAARRLIGSGPEYFLAEIFLAGNTRVNRGRDQSSAQVNALAANANSSLWTGLGAGFEHRLDFLSVTIAGNIIFTSTSLTPHWALHGGAGFGF